MRPAAERWQALLPSVGESVEVVVQTSRDYNLEFERT